MNNKERSKAIWRLMRQRLHTEKVVLCILAVSVTYAFISNLLTHCSPLPLSSNILDILASFDETVRNCCYGIIASVAFYLINNFYKNAYKKVDLFNEMYPDLYNLWLRIYQLALALNDYELSKEQSNDELRLSITEILSNQDNKETSHKMVHEISSDKFYLLYVSWLDALKDKDKFLETYGHLIEREEYSKLNDKEFDFSIERLKDYEPNDEQIAKATIVSIREYDIQRTIYLILKYKTDLASMANKYSVFYYDNRRGIRKDTF